MRLPRRAAAARRGSQQCAAQRASAARPLVQPSSSAVAAPCEQLEIAVEQPALELHLGVASHDQRQAIGLGGRVRRAGDQLVGLHPEHTGQQRDRALPRRAQIALEVGDGHT